MGVDMIGNAEEAVFIHNWWHSPARGSYSQPPAGWTYLGGGCYRSAYLAPSGVVYKVQKDLSGESWQTNYGEWQTWKRLYLSCKMPKRSRLPQLGFYPVPGGENHLGVIAIEKLDGVYSYYGTYKDENGEPQYWSTVCSAIGEATGVGDLYGDNLMIDEKNNLLVPTDLGCASSDY
jgi:hypothetical protein